MSQASGKDLTTLQGTWEEVAYEADGISKPPDEFSVPSALTTFTEHNFSVRTAEGILLLEGTFALDASADPKMTTLIRWAPIRARA